MKNLVLFGLVVCMLASVVSPASADVFLPFLSSGEAVWDDEVIVICVTGQCLRTGYDLNGGSSWNDDRLVVSVPYRMDLIGKFGQIISVTTPGQRHVFFYHLDFSGKLTEEQLSRLWRSEGITVDQYAGNGMYEVKHYFVQGYMNGD